MFSATKFLVRLGITIICCWLLFRSTQFFDYMIHMTSSIAATIAVIATSLVLFYIVLQIRVILYHLFMKETKKVTNQIVTEVVEAHNGIRNRKIKTRVEREENDKVKDILMKHYRSINFRRFFWWIVTRAYVVAGVIFFIGFSMIFIVLTLLLSIIGGKLFHFIGNILKSIKEFVLWFFKLGELA